MTAPLRGPGLDRLRDVADVEFDPWIEHQPIRLLGADDLAARLAEMSADLLVCEADECKGPVFEQPLRAVASTRGDPTNVDVAGATAAGIPVLHAPGRNADGVAEMAVGADVCRQPPRDPGRPGHAGGHGVHRHHPLSAL